MMNKLKKNIEFFKKKKKKKLIYSFTIFMKIYTLEFLYITYLLKQYRTCI